MAKKCKHKYRQIARSCLTFYGVRLPKRISKIRVPKEKQCEPVVQFSCMKCGDRKEKPMTITEKKKYSKKDREMWRESTRLHKVWHKFINYFFDHKKDEWKWIGHDLICRIRAYSKRNKNIVITSCDDDMHANAILVLVPHINAKGHWGTSVVYVSQFDVLPIKFFLYPSHERDLRKGLTEAKKKRWK